jgi:hypothetical protein
MENENLEPIGEIKMAPAQKLEQCEWVFQFDDDEPQIFAWTSEDSPDEEPTVTLTINNTKDAYISFTNRNSGKKFKLFPRELSAEGIKLRDSQNKELELLKQSLENESENTKD